MHCSLLSLGCLCGFALPVNASLTGLRALKIAQRRLRPEVRSKLLGISSARTDIAFVPKMWRFVFLDQKTKDHCRIVTVAAQASSGHPDTIKAFVAVEPENGLSMLPIALSELVIDSDVVLERVRLICKLKGITTAEYQMRRTRDEKIPMWQLLLYGQAPEPVATFRVNAATGAIQLDNKPDSAG
jgi:hypothetical protein